MRRAGKILTEQELWMAREYGWYVTVKPLYNLARMAGHEWAQVPWSTYAKLWERPGWIREFDIETLFYANVADGLYKERKPYRLQFPPLELFTTVRTEGEVHLGKPEGRHRSKEFITVLTDAGQFSVSYWKGDYLFSPYTNYRGHPEELARIIALYTFGLEWDYDKAKRYLQDTATRSAMVGKEVDCAKEAFERFLLHPQEMINLQASPPVAAVGGV